MGRGDIVVQGASTSRPRQSGSQAPAAPVVIVQKPFALDDIRHVRVAAWRAHNPFFDHVCVDGGYTRTVFCGRGLLFIATRLTPRPVWRVWLAWFARASNGAWLGLVPYVGEYVSADVARRAAEALAARMHGGSWEEALGLFTGRACPGAGDGASM